METKKVLDPVERAKLFAQSTRRYIQKVGTKTGAESSSVSFDLPKVRLLAGVKLEITATLTGLNPFNLRSSEPHRHPAPPFTDKVSPSPRMAVHRNKTSSSRARNS
jgi:hypothetical protein